DGNAAGDVPLHKVILQLKKLYAQSVDEKKEFITRFWKGRTKAENFVFNKLITGNFRMGLSKQLVIKSLALYLEKDEKEIAHRLMGKWDPETESMESLFSDASAGAKDFLPYPFFLAYPLEEEPSGFLGDINDWFL